MHENSSDCAGLRTWLLSEAIARLFDRKGRQGCEENPQRPLRPLRQERSRRGGTGFLEDQAVDLSMLLCIASGVMIVCHHFPNDHESPWLAR